MAKKPKMKETRPARVVASQSPPTESQPPRYVPEGGGKPVPRDVIPETETEESGDAA